MRDAQRGQALVLAVGLLLIGAAAVFVLANAGRATATKHRLVNAADAAAYSAAAWRARVLNFDAYANRAIVANEVAIAQAVTLVSWSKYFEQLADNAATVSRFFPPVAAAFEAVHEVATWSREAAEYAAELEVAARGAAGIGYKDLLQTGQELMHLTADAFALSMLTAEVARANDQAFFAFVLPGDGFGRFTRRYDSLQDRQRLREVVEASLDPFTGGPRSADLPAMIGGCGPSLDRDRMFDWIHRRGATVLGDDLDRWEAHDTVSLHAWRRGGLLGLGGCRESEVLALGWGAAEADATSDGTISTRAHDTARNESARGRAESDMQAFETYGGLARVRELDFDALEDDRFPVARLAVLARTDGEPAAATRTQARPQGAGRLALRPAYPQGRLWALAAAEVRFARPASSGGVEYASLYSPYWQARLVEPSVQHRALAEGYAR